MWWLLACTEKEISSSPPEDTEDTEDTDTDDTEDTQDTLDTTSTGQTGDTGEPPPTGDTGEPPVACTGVETDLVPFLEARDGGGACTTCDAGNIVFYGGFQNPCEVDIELEVAAGCGLVREMEITGQNGAGFGLSAPCNGPITTRTVFAGDRVEEYVNDYDMSAQNWQVEGRVGSSTIYVVPSYILTVQ